MTAMSYLKAFLRLPNHNRRRLTARSRAHAAFAGVVVCPRSLRPRNCRFEFSIYALLSLPTSFPVFSSLLRFIRLFGNFGPPYPRWRLFRHRYPTQYRELCRFRGCGDRGTRRTVRVFISYPNIFFLCLFYISSCVNFKIHRPKRFFLRSQQ